MVATCLYLAKRVRPVIVLAVSFLCMTVKEPNVQDQCMVLCISGYLQRTKECRLFMGPAVLARVEAYVNVTHLDGKFTQES
jgi:hypothetical protein